MKLPKFQLNAVNIVNLIGLVVILNLVVILAQTVQRNYRLNQQIDTLTNQTALLQDQKDQLEYSIRYYGTDSFRDREARSKLGLQLPGENVVIIPRPAATPVPQADTSGTAKPSNFQQWLDFLSGRRAS